jgi:hypothetical protein
MGYLLKYSHPPDEPRSLLSLAQALVVHGET